MADPQPPLEMSRYCVPFTPFRKKLEESTVCLVTTAAVRRQDDTPFNVEGDTTFRVISSATEGRELTYDDAHYDHACVDQDINCVFPLDRLRALATEGRIGGLSEAHFSMGFSQALRELRETTVPRIAREVERVRPDAVLLTGG
jgi:D-proline reductase (dithiol) PrdB